MCCDPPLVATASSIPSTSILVPSRVSPKDQPPSETNNLPSSAPPEVSTIPLSASAPTRRSGASQPNYCGPWLRSVG